MKMPHSDKDEIKRLQGIANKQSKENYAMHAILNECLQDYGALNFTDRHGMADRIRAVLKAQQS
jgi:hypothetical protein